MPVVDIRSTTKATCGPAVNGLTSRPQETEELFAVLQFLPVRHVFDAGRREKIPLDVLAGKSGASQNGRPGKASNKSQRKMEDIPSSGLCRSASAAVRSGADDWNNTACIPTVL